MESYHIWGEMSRGEWGFCGEFVANVRRKYTANARTAKFVWFLCGFCMVFVWFL